MLKVLHLPMANVLLILGLSLLSMLYLIAGAFIFSSPPRTDQVVLLSVLSGVALSIGCIALLFKLQYWPMSQLFGLMAVSGFVVTIAWGVMASRERPDRAGYRQRLFSRLLPMGIVTLLLVVIPMRTRMSLQYRDDNELQLRHDCYTRAYPGACDSLDRYTGEFVER
ncbi:MAG: hypothetical protein IPO17_11200 [Flavobacteriales bacterium]|nr:hypothetical protein [Flavobacteriales bacterium]